MIDAEAFVVNAFLQRFLPSIVDNCDLEVVVRLLPCVRNVKWSHFLNLESKWNPVGVHTLLFCMNRAEGLEDSRVGYWNST